MLFKVDSSASSCFSQIFDLFLREDELLLSSVFFF